MHRVYKSEKNKKNVLSFFYFLFFFINFEIENYSKQKVMAPKTKRSKQKNTKNMKIIAQPLQETDVIKRFLIELFLIRNIQEEESFQTMNIRQNCFGLSSPFSFQTFFAIFINFPRIFSKCYTFQNIRYCLFDNAAHVFELIFG